MADFKREKFGGNERVNFSKIKNVLDIPYLIEVQKDSYKWFCSHGIKEVLEDFSPITDKSGKYELHFLDYVLEGKPKYDEKECKDRDVNYALPLRVKVRLLKKDDTEDFVDQEVFMGDFPLMTKNGSFIINGAERVIVSQLVRSPGVYCDRQIDKKEGRDIFDTTVIPSRGAWLELKQDISPEQDAEIMYISVDRTRKVTVTTFLRALGYGTDEEISKLFGGDKTIVQTCVKDPTKTETEGLVEIFKRLKPGEMPTNDTIKTQLASILFDQKRYDLAKVGRYKFNKKLSIAGRISNQISAENIISLETGEILVKKGQVILPSVAAEIQNSGINEVTLSFDKETHKVIGNNTVSLKSVTGIDYHEIDGLVDQVYFPTLKELIEKANGEEQLKDLLFENVNKLAAKHILIDDIISIISYNLGMKFGVGQVDNIDHLGNRRVKSVGELLQNQFRIGIARLERVIKERMSTQDSKEVTPQSLINVRPISSAIKEFFGSSQLSQFMDQVNPIAELTHKRKLSALGPGGLNRERATFDVRDVHHSHYGRMCPIETPEGQNIGLITSLSSFARINEYGFIESPYRKVDAKTGVITEQIDYLTADEEDKYTVAQANEPLDELGRFQNGRVTCRRKEEILEVDKEQIDYMDVSPKQLVSIATALIPFLENDDTNRALMGSNMQRQAVPLLRTEAPIVATGVEAKIAADSGVMIVAQGEGIVLYASADEIKVKYDGEEEEIVSYSLRKFQRSNQGTCVNQKPVISVGERVEKGQVLADGPSTDNGELALGRNILIGFMEWEGYNFEDAILISEKLVKEDVFTSIHIEEHETEARDTKLGPEDITRDIPNTGEEALKNLDENGVIRVGAEVKAGDILVGKVTPKGETELTPEDRLLRAIFGEKAKEVRDTSLRVPHGGDGIVVDVKIFTRENKDELSPGVNKVVRVYIAQKRKISIGDKMAGRHGNKGVISRILPVEDMPFMEDGTPLEIVLNPLGVPSRMNIGQVLEVHLGLVAKALGIKVATPVFDGANEKVIKELLEGNGFTNSKGEADGKVQLYDGRTGEAFENRVTVGQMYMLKLNHLVDDKIHARSTGPYSLVTQQPLGGKAQFGGQRFGEMEVWALEAYGASHILQEVLTVKSDDIVGRVKTYESIVRGSNISEPGIPESFKVLIKELQALSLDVKVLTEDQREIAIKEFQDEMDVYDDPKQNVETVDEVDLFSDFDDEDDDFDTDLDKDYEDDPFGDIFEGDED